MKVKTLVWEARLGGDCQSEKVAFTIIGTYVYKLSSGHMFFTPYFLGNTLDGYELKMPNWPGCYISWEQAEKDANVHHGKIVTTLIEGLTHA